MNNILYVYPALVTWTVLVFYMLVSFAVGRARIKYNVAAPHTTGSDDFLRYFRVQQNTLEQLILFLPSLWLFAIYINPLWAACFGLLWLTGRIIYAIGYYKAPEKRLPGFVIGLLSTAVMLVWSLYGMIEILLIISQLQAG